MNKAYGAGDLIIRENTPGDSAYIVIRGRVEVSKVIDGQRVVLDTMGPGSIFGEMSLIDGQPRSATVTAVEATTLSLVDSKRFQVILNAIPREVRPLFSSLSERLRNTNKLVSVLNQRSRLIYSASSLFSLMLAEAEEQSEKVVSIKLKDVVYEGCRVLAVEKERLESVYRALAQTSLVNLDKSNGHERLIVGDPAMLKAFVEFMAEKMSYIPGFPPPSKKFSALSPKAQQVLFYLRSVAAQLPEDKKGYCHFDFDNYVKQATATLKMGVKDAIITLQSLAGAGHVRLEKFSEEVQNKAVVFRAQDVSRAQLVLLQVEQFEQIYETL